MDNLLNRHGNFEAAYYGLFTHLLHMFNQMIEQKIFVVPQFRLRWRPLSTRFAVPDFVLTDPEGWIGGGVELKRASRIPGQPHEFNSMLFSMACIQAADQAKAVFRSGIKGPARPIPWLVSQGSWLSLRTFGPFPDAHLVTRGHRSNSSADYAVSAALEEHRQRQDLDYRDQAVLIESDEGLSTVVQFVTMVVSVSTIHMPWLMSTALQEGFLRSD